MGAVVEGVDSEDGSSGEGAKRLSLDGVRECWGFYPVEHFDGCIVLLCCVSVRYVLYAPVDGCWESW